MAFLSEMKWTQIRAPGLRVQSAPTSRRETKPAS
ncbi:hypothetical protein FOXG_21200 [Fusarium oxysporum f. sp. lycopersici 4287]|uniref:Uncharacterized protein n=2 Tax=Fusarium oxysporum TaxID=5507 RepID=A0A0J9VVM5_FUSO4|nr:hypothetical protein FOXG_21200 [Fusarium oxysporum f. sp. lycopersici 4287]EXK36093.1 hypothetical protein FOMG_09282 [Fusarium oxysporum f. sp. melonis 26406]KAI8402337.1 hypothetical protein FOFC_17645 [Fusarium oxysporum]KNB14766.1 hypothetical protein FOXG_21200 [Fusarium oxysporum f. sp. lycopersici 4287]